MAAVDHRRAIRIAIVGTGYVADLYMPSLRTFPEFEICGVWDKDPRRLAAFAAHWRVPAAESFEALTGAGPLILLNLTNPYAHEAINRAALDAGCHVWCEKPLALSYEDAERLAALAAAKGLHLASAPCNLLGASAQTLWRAIRDGRIGTPRLAYAELDDDFLPAAPWRSWRSESGAPWPAEDEFRTGCTLEHAGYHLGPLMAMFGPVRRLVSSSTRLLDPGQTGAGHASPDYASATLFFDAMVARLTCSIVAVHDHRLRIFGDDGVLETDEAWSNTAAVRIRRRHVIRRRLFNSPFATRIRPSGAAHPMVPRRGSATMNFALGIAEMARAIAAGRTPRLAGDFALHMTEVALAMQAGGEHRPRSSFEAMVPMDWAL